MSRSKNAVNASDELEANPSLELRSEMHQSPTRLVLRSRELALLLSYSPICQSSAGSLNDVLNTESTVLLCGIGIY